MEDWTHRDSEEAFEDAIGFGVLNTDQGSDRYAGKWMYMGTDPRRGDAFKNINFRNYIYVAEEISR